MQSQRKYIVISKQQIKQVKSLHTTKFRHSLGRFIVEGEKTSVEFLKANKYLVEEVFVLKNRLYKYQPLLTGFNLENLYEVSSQNMDAISCLTNPSDILLVCCSAEDNFTSNESLLHKIIYLDGVQDPGNVGTIIRLADWFGVDGVVRSSNSADFFNPKVVQASMGSLNNVLLCTKELRDLLYLNLPVFGTFMNGADYKSISDNKAGILVLGSEGRGISEDNLQYVTDKITVQGSAQRIADSLNVSVAAGIICAAWASS